VGGEVRKEGNLTEAAKDCKSKTPDLNLYLRSKSSQKGGSKRSKSDYILKVQMVKASGETRQHNGKKKRVF